MAEQIPLAPVPTREAVVIRAPLTLTATWIRWFDALRALELRQQATLADHDTRLGGHDTTLADHESRLDAVEAQLAAITPVVEAWTPSLVGTTGGSAHTYAVRWGSLVRTGRMITFGYRLQLSARDATMGGVVTVTGLPYATAYNAVAVIPLTTAFLSVTLAGNYTTIFSALRGTTQVLDLYQTGKDLDWDPLPASAITATTELAVSGTYWTA